MGLKRILTDAQIVGVFIMVFGLICEIITNADWGWFVFTCGSLYFTLATKIKYRHKMKRKQ
ncbi:MAG: hypothetical protein DRP29_00550 [Thermodesulfobacteriota bacterium]|nr:MAG: hypothetical protein DRP29_00550 [Thermodesulfobacteriota bacterium]